MSTSSVSFNVPSNSWTGSIDVTSCELSTDISVFDVRIFYDGVEQGSPEIANWTKVSVTSLSYSGSALNQNDVVRIERETPASQIVTVLPLQTISSGAWNAEFTRIYNILEEQRTYGLPDGTVSVSDETYGSGWDGVTSAAPSKNSVYDKINTLETTTIPGYIEDTAYSSGWNGDTTHAPSQNAVYDIMSSTITDISDNRDIGNISGRLTLSSGDPVPTSSSGVSGSTVYFTPYLGNRLYLYDGSSWDLYNFSEVSFSVGTMTDNLPYDLFIYDNSGTLTIEKVAWTNNTTRATALAYQDGIYVKTGELTKRYLGSIASPGSNTVYQGAYTISTNTSFHNTLYNYYNQVTYRTTSSFTANPGASGAWSLYGASHSGLQLLGTLKGLLNLHTHVVWTNGAASTTNCYISFYDNFNSVLFTSNGAPIGVSNSHHLCCSASFSSPSRLYSVSPRYFVNAHASQTINSGLHYVTIQC